MLGRGEEKKKEPGCGKKLDSAAKTDAEGRIWCRECLVSSTRPVALSQSNIIS